jgi:hypothetical protein
MLSLEQHIRADVILEKKAVSWSKELFKFLDIVQFAILESAFF